MLQASAAKRFTWILSRLAAMEADGRKDEPYERVN